MAYIDCENCYHIASPILYIILMILRVKQNAKKLAFGLLEILNH